MTPGGAIPLQCAPTDLAALLRSILQVMQPQARAIDVTLHAEIDSGVPPTVDIDARKMAWAVAALVGNALRYVRHGTARMPGGSIVVRATLDATAHEIDVDVQDDGPGIPAERIRGLAGAALDESGGGLALAMIRDVVAAHGGRFEIRSQTDALDHGTTVRLTLPAAADGTGSASPATTSTPVASRASSR